MFLDLCCGTQSLKSVAELCGYEYIGLDINKTTDGKEPNICCDLKEWDYKTYFETHTKPTFIWFSPPCREYSQLNNARPNKICDISGSNEIVKKGIEIIQYCGCKYVIENPDTSKLKKQDFMTFNYAVVDYCAYGFAYRKRTRLWNNFNFMGNKCKGKGECPFMEGGRHIYSIGNSSYKTNVRELNMEGTRLGQRYAIPKKLIKDILTFNNTL